MIGALAAASPRTSKLAKSPPARDTIRHRVALWFVPWSLSTSLANASYGQAEERKPQLKSRARLRMVNFRHVRPVISRNGKVGDRMRPQTNGSQVQRFTCGVDRPAIRATEEPDDRDRIDVSERTSPRQPVRPQDACSGGPLLLAWERSMFMLFFTIILDDRHAFADCRLSDSLVFDISSLSAA